MTNPTETDRVNRSTTRRWLPLAKLRVEPMAQRTLKQAKVDEMAADFNLGALGVITVSHRDAHYYIVDGMHRVNALRDIGFADLDVECDVIEGLTIEQEADLFLELNNRLTVDTIAKFRVAVTANRRMQAEIASVLAEEGMAVTRDKTNGAVMAVGTLERIYKRADIGTVRRAVRLVYQGYGDVGLKASVIDGMGYVCQRYNGELDDQQAIEILRDTAGGVGAMMSRGNNLRVQMAAKVGHSYAAAMVEALNAGGMKLRPYFKDLKDPKPVKGKS